MTHDADLRQLKLSSGEEIVCEVVQWSDQNIDLELVVRKAMRLVMQETMDGTAIKYYSFRPWMVYQESQDDLLIINANNVVGIAFPPETLIVQYMEAVDEMIRQNADREKEHNKRMVRKPSIKSQEPTEHLSPMLDSGSNVIDMFDPKKVH